MCADSRMGRRIESVSGKRLAFVGKYMASRTNGTGCECRALYVVDSDGTAFAA